jgi:hypothetical protein
MKITSVLLAAAMIFLGACGNTEVVPHTNRPGDNYCTYTITAVDGNGGALKVDDKVCIYCKPGGSPRCPTHNRSIEANGITYSLKNSGNICSTCANKNTYEVK